MDRTSESSGSFYRISTGQTVGPISLKRGIGEYVFVFEQTRVIFNYRVLVETTGAQLAFFQFDRPGSGIWKIIPETLELGNGIFHIWLPMEEFLTEMSILSVQIRNIR